MIKEWVKGEKMVFEANPYFFKGAPKTPNLVIAFVSPPKTPKPSCWAGRLTCSAPRPWPV